MFPEKRIRNSRIILAIAVLALLGFVASEVCHTKPSVRFVRFEKVIWPGTDTPDVVPIFEIQNRTNKTFHYYSRERFDGPYFASQVLHTQGGVSLPEKYHIGSSDCGLSIRFESIAPGASRQISSGFFGMGEDAFRIGVQIRPASRELRFDSISNQTLRDLMRLWELVLDKVMPDRDLSWSEQVQMPEDLRWFRKSDPPTIDPQRIWPLKY